MKDWIRLRSVMTFLMLSWWLHMLAQVSSRQQCRNIKMRVACSRFWRWWSFFRRSIILEEIRFKWALKKVSMAIDELVLCWTPFVLILLVSAKMMGAGGSPSSVLLPLIRRPKETTWSIPCLETMFELELGGWCCTCETLWSAAKAVLGTTAFFASRDTSRLSWKASTKV